MPIQEPTQASWRSGRTGWKSNLHVSGLEATGRTVGSGLLIRGFRVRVPGGVRAKVLIRGLDQASAAHFPGVSAAYKSVGRGARRRRAGVATLAGRLAARWTPAEINGRLGATGAAGTPQIRVGRRLIPSRRVVWELAHGPITGKVSVAACRLPRGADLRPPRAPLPRAPSS